MYNYCGVKFNRGTGLGNRLFPWARCVIYSKKNNLPMLWPHWFNIRKASFLKGGIDYRASLGKILLYDNFTNNGNYVSNLDRYILNRVSQEETTWFSGDANYFNDLHEHHLFIKEELSSIVNRSVMKNLNFTAVPPIVLNIRTGRDFIKAETEDDYLNKGAIRTPLSWFSDTLKQIRIAANSDIPAIVISDGTPHILKEILELPNVNLAKTNTAISDLLLMSKAKIILGSGGSSFTAWGSFLSKAITLTIPGQSLQWFKVSADQNIHLVQTFDPTHPDLEIIQKIKNELQFD